jgi:GNAT superfamily N-acetyltransferase
VADTGDVLAMGLPADVKAPDPPGLEMRWLTTLEVFGGTRASDDDLARRLPAYRATFAAGTGGAVVAYVDGDPAAVAGVEIADGVARLAGGAVLEAYRGRGVYRALVATRLTYAAERGATMALTQGRTSTSSPILRRLGFVSYGQERSYRLPLD